jgi:putative transposase
MELFKKDADFAAFERVLAQAQSRHDMRLLSWCIMPNHWHLVVWPRADGQLGRFMQRLTITHVRRWQEHRHRVGEGHVYQGRYKSFPVQSDEHLLTVNRYVERNALRANLVKRAEDWRWGSLWRWVNRHKAIDDVPELSDWPTACGGRPRNWRQRVNQPETQDELEAMRRCVNRGQPYGGETWTKRVTKLMDLASTFRQRGRPRKTPPGLQ